MNSTHLHPKYGEKTPKQELKELQEIEEDGEVDLNLQEYNTRSNASSRGDLPTHKLSLRFAASMVPPEFIPPRTVSPKSIDEIETSSPSSDGGVGR